MMPNRPRTTRLRRICMFGTCGLIALASSNAGADVVLPGTVRVNHSIQVDVEGALPPGKVLVLTGTWGGAEVIHPNAVVPFTIGKYELLRLFVIDSSDLPELNRIVSEWHPGRGAYEERAVITNRGTACSDYLEIPRRTETTSSVKEVRVFYRVNVVGTSCAGELLHIDQLSASGHLIQSEMRSVRWTGVTPEPSNAVAAPSTPPLQEQPEQEQPAVSPEATHPNSLPKGTTACGSCVIGEDAHEGERYAAMLTLLGAVAFTVRRSRMRAK